MGYDLHITRKANWFDEGDDIALSEWEGIVESDPEMRLDNFAEATTTEGKKIRIDAEGLAVWKAYSGHQEDGNKAWFYFYDGRITVKNPDMEIRKKMFALAQVLKARLQGDEGEFYGPEGGPEGGQDTASPMNGQPDRPKTSRKPWWKKW